MEVVYQTIATVIVIAVFLSLIIIPVVISIRHQAASDRRITNKLPDTKIIHGFPIPQAIESKVQYVLRQTIQKFRILVLHKNWFFIQVTSGRLSAVTIFEDRTLLIASVFCMTLDYQSPTMAIRRKEAGNFILRPFVQDIKSGKLIWCEGVFSAEQEVYCDPTDHVDVLQILSPETLEVIQKPPFGADIIIFKDQLYYIFHNNQTAEKLIPLVLQHATVVKQQLEDNLARWTRAASNQQKVNEIATRQFPVGLLEKFENAR